MPPQEAGDNYWPRITPTTRSRPRENVAAPQSRRTSLAGRAALRDHPFTRAAQTERVWPQPFGQQPNGLDRPLEGAVIFQAQRFQHGVVHLLAVDRPAV